MTKPSDLPLYLCLYKLTKYLYLLIHHFKKEYKYTLGQSVLDLSWGTLDLVILANTLPNPEKPAIIRESSAVFDQFKTRLRMAHELGLITHKKYTYLIEKNEEIGRMLTGWLRWARMAKGPNTSLGGHTSRSW